MTLLQGHPATVAIKKLDSFFFAVYNVRDVDFEISFQTLQKPKRFFY